MSRKTSEWEKKFERNYTCLSYTDKGRVVGYWDDNTTPRFIESKKVKAFISDLLAKEKMELVERIEGIIDAVLGYIGDEEEYKCARNRWEALKSEIQEKEEEVGG